MGSLQIDDIAELLVLVVSHTEFNIKFS